MPEKYEDNDNRRKRVVVITGSGKGIGRTIATEFAKSGYYTMINDLEQEEELKHAAEEISKKIGDDNNNKVAYVVGDVSQEKIAITLIEETMKRFGRIDTLVNTAAISEKVYTKRTNETSSTPATDSLYKQASPYFTLEEYEIADTYLKGVYYCIREAAKQMVITAYEDQEKRNTTQILELLLLVEIVQLSIYRLLMNQFPRLRQRPILFQCRGLTLSRHLGSE
jgi:NAD(P)-dependent dehydrogenase (short-subunit alcohol dehydrogenase family)